jgi:hypothetical protein
MAHVNGEIRHPDFDIELDVLQYTSDEEPENRKAIVDFNLGFNFPSTITPDELFEIGQWLIEQSGVIKKKFTATGKPKHQKEV